MIEHLTVENSKIKELKKSFPHTFGENYVNSDNPFTEILTYSVENKIIAWIAYDKIYDRAELCQIEVLTEYRQQHIASKLLEWMIRDCRDREISQITLEVNINNIAAIRLYQKYGFQQIALRRNYYHGKDGILMERREKMKDVYIFAIESSCDETSCSIVKNGSQEIATVVLSQISIHKDFGGVVPEIASRHHVKNITMVIEECLEKAKMNMKQMDAIAVTYGPGLIGSLLIGVEAAKTLSYVYDKPLIPVHHISGHIYANNLKEEMKFPLIALVISGGHTELIYMKDHYCFEKLGGTLDDAIGECYDKVARVMNVPYPGGPTIDQWAHEGTSSYSLPLPLNNNSYDFSFSGLKSAVINLVHNEQQRGNEIRKKDLATSFQNTVVEIITKKTMKALKDKQVNNLIVAGGVAANCGIREKLTELCQNANVHYTFPDIKYCTDNAAMIASSAYFAYRKKRFGSLDLNSKSSDILK